LDWIVSRSFDVCNKTLFTPLTITTSTALARVQDVAAVIRSVPTSPAVDRSPKKNGGLVNGNASFYERLGFVDLDPEAERSKK
jgi:hypothetical protein